MSCREFLDLGFKYDNLLMEESAQILEIETFIPMLLQVGGAVQEGGRGGWDVRVAASAAAVAPLPQRCCFAVLHASAPPCGVHPPCPALQRPEDGHNRLKRVVLIGDHHQLPPVVKNQVGGWVGGRVGGRGGGPAAARMKVRDGKPWSTQVN